MTLRMLQLAPVILPSRLNRNRQKRQESEATRILTIRALQETPPSEGDSFDITVVDDVFDM